MINVLDIIVFVLLIFIIYRYYLIRKIFKDKTTSELSGCEVGNKILENNKLDNIYIVKTSNPFEEGYNSDRNVIKLPRDTFDGENLIHSILVARDCSSAILYKNNNKIFKLKNILSNVINVLIYLCYLSIIICSILKNFYFLRISIIVLIIVILYHFMFINLEKKINSLTLSQLKDIDIINDNKIDKANEIFDILKYSYITNPINLVHKIIIYFFKK